MHAHAHAYVRTCSPHACLSARVCTHAHVLTPMHARPQLTRPRVTFFPSTHTHSCPLLALARASRVLSTCRNAKLPLLHPERRAPDRWVCSLVFLHTNQRPLGRKSAFESASPPLGIRVGSAVPPFRDFLAPPAVGGWGPLLPPVEVRLAPVTMRP